MILKTGKSILKPFFKEGGSVWKQCRKTYVYFYTILYRIRSRTIRIYKTYISQDSIFFDDENLWMCGFAHRKKVELCKKIFNPGTIVDVGCGLGNTISEFRKHGIEAFGVEGSGLAISKSKESEHIHQADLNQPLNLGRKFDLVWCVEVLEHIHPKFVDVIVESLCRHGNRLLVSAAPPGQHGELHFNEQPKEYWISKFTMAGFALSKDETIQFQSLDEEFSENVLIFERQIKK